MSSGSTSATVAWRTPGELRITRRRQGKIERYHRTMKNVVKLQHYYFPWELEAALRDFVAYYNNDRKTVRGADGARQDQATDDETKEERIPGRKSRLG